MGKTLCKNADTATKTWKRLSQEGVEKIRN